MKISTGFFALLICSLFLLTSGKDSADIIYWTADQQLSWTDFEGQPRYEYKGVSALTSSGIDYYTGCQDGKIIYKVQSYFEKKESWVKDEARTNHHLQHEQLHFDITELNARRLRKALSKQTFKCDEIEAFHDFVDQYIQKWEHEQKAFDALSRHSLDRKKQREWRFRIALEMNLLEGYASGQ